MAFWPSLGADVAGVTFSEKGSEQQFVSFDSAHASVKLMPLLRGQYIVDSVKLSGVKARIVKGKDGRYNFSDLMEGGDKKEAPSRRKRRSLPRAVSPLVFDVSSVSIEKAAITLHRPAAGQEYAIEDFKLKTGRIAQDAEGKLELAMVAKRKAPALEVKLSADGKYQFKGGILSGDVTAKLDESTHQGEIHRCRTLRLRGEHRPVQRRPATSAGDSSRCGGQTRGAGKKAGRRPRSRSRRPSRRTAPIDLSALKGINASGKLQVGALQVRGLKLADVNAQLNAANGTRRRRAALGQALRGHGRRARSSLDANRNHIALKEQLTGIAIGPLLRDFAQSRTSSRARATSRSTSPPRARRVNAMKRSLGRHRQGATWRTAPSRASTSREIIRKGRSLLGARLGRRAGRAPATRRSRPTSASSPRASRSRTASRTTRTSTPRRRCSGSAARATSTSPAASLDYVAKAAVVGHHQGPGRAPSATSSPALPSRCASAGRSTT